MTLFFYDIYGPYGCFSNYSEYPFELDGWEWLTSEHYYQAQKFIGTIHYHQIREAPNAKAAAKIGRDRDLPLRDSWREIKVGIMKKAVFAKFSAHEDIRQILLDTGDEELVENAPRDYFWACGADGGGLNMFGKVLMEVRNEFIENLRRT